MCFTVNVNIIKEELESRYGTKLLDPEKYIPSYYYHAFAFPEMPVVHMYDKQGKALSLFKWGLIPGWVKDDDEAENIRKLTHNARSETLGEKASFSDAYKKRRCLVPVAGFYEWQHIGKDRRPWYIYNPGETIMSLAGLFEKWTDETKGKDIFTFSIITTRANKKMSQIHNSKDRMPVIIPSDKEETWLSGDMETIKELMEPLASDRLAYHTVNPNLFKKEANKNRPELIEPYTHPEQTTLF